MFCLDVIIRAASASLLLGLALLVLRDAPRERIAWLFLLLALGLCGFLARNTPEPSLALPDGPAPLASLLSGSAALFLWWFALALFDDDFEFGPQHLGVGGTWLAAMLVSRMILDGGVVDEVLSWTLVAIAAGMVGHILYRLIRDLEGDLIEARRNARAVLAGALAALLLVDVGVDVLMGLTWKPHWFTVAQNGVLLLVAVLLGNWLLSARVGKLAFRNVEPRERDRVAFKRPEPRPVAADADARLLGRLHALMEGERIYRDPDLSFPAFAARMAAPEAEVRRLINQRLGHGHFRSFVNAYRVDEARRLLAHPATAERKMVAIAFDVGFASLASFNRAFKLAEGRAPSEFREDLRRGGGPAGTGLASV